jgi:hypothetical protein
MRLTRKRATTGAIALVALAAAMPAPASADATLTFPGDNAACIAKAWVPFNTDPTVEAGALGAFLSSDPPRNGELRQNDCHH